VIYRFRVTGKKRSLSLSLKYRLYLHHRQHRHHGCRHQPRIQAKQQQSSLSLSLKLNVNETYRGYFAIAVNLISTRLPLLAGSPQPPGTLLGEIET
jgi:hypothetical protein